MMTIYLRNDRTRKENLRQTNILDYESGSQLLVLRSPPSKLFWDWGVMAPGPPGYATAGPAFKRDRPVIRRSNFQTAFYTILLCRHA